MSLHELLGRILRLPLRGPTVNLDEWWEEHQRLTSAYSSTFVRAFVGGYQADRLGYAFASGYQEAIRCLLPVHPPADKLALCATEKAGAHPSSIETTLIADRGGYRLSGSKTWVTLGTHADALVVVATTGKMDLGRNQLAAVLVPSHREGVRLDPMPETPFVPEIPHATVTFDEVKIDPAERLEGDGYERVLKPFRTIEDIHVHTALLGYLLRIARAYEFPADTASAMLAIAVTLRALVEQPPLDPAVHVALAGAIAQTERLVESLEPHWHKVDEPTRKRWQRDKALLRVADKARARRFEVAWQRLTAR